MTNESELNDRERRFVIAFVTASNGNATQAAVLAGYSKRTARVQASQLLTKLNIRTAIHDLANAGDREAIAAAHERDVILTRILRDESNPVRERIRAISELNKCSGRHVTRHQVAGRLTLEEALSASRE